MSAQPHPTAVSPWLPIAMPDPARMNLLCLPYAGAGANIYLPLRDLLDAEMRVCPIEYPGRARRYGEAMPACFGNLIDSILDGLCPHLPPRFVYFGHSMGGLLAYELARCSHERGLPLPKAIIVSSWRAPGSPGRVPLRHHLDDRAFLDELRAMGGTPEEVLSNPKLTPFVLPIARADFALIERWQSPAAAPLPIPIHVLGGDADPDVPLDQLHAWSVCSSKEVKINVFEGGHFSVHRRTDDTVEIIRRICNNII